MKKITFLIFLLIATSTIFAYTEVSGNITGTVTWVAGTYYATSDLDVNSTATLTLNPGVIIKFAPGTQFKITGTLYSNGTDLGANKIVFTSRDDNTHGETIAESDGVPNPGDWEGFWFDGTQGSYPGKG